MVFEGPSGIRDEALGILEAMAAELHVLLDAIVSHSWLSTHCRQASSTLARSSHGLEAVIAMVAQRKDAQLANMAGASASFESSEAKAAVLRALEQAKYSLKVIESH